MEPIATPVPESSEKSIVEELASVMWKIILALFLVFVVMAAISATHDPAMNHTGGGSVTMSVPLGTTSCMVTVKQDDGTSHTYDKLVAPYCTGFSVGKRVHVTKGMVD